MDEGALRNLQRLLKSSGLKLGAFASGCKQSTIGVLRAESSYIQLAGIAAASLDRGSPGASGAGADWARVRRDALVV